MTWFRSSMRHWGGRLSHAPLRRRLGRSAARYASHGWDVMPGSFLNGSRFDCGQPACRTVSCHPALADWQAAAGHDSATVRAWWRETPFTVLLATGTAFDVLEVPALLGQPVIDAVPASVLGGPVAVAPQDRWMFLVRPGWGLSPVLAGRADVVLHGRGSWVPAPPTRQPNGAVRWALDPRQVGFQGADPLLVQSLLIAAIPRGRSICPPARVHALDAGGTAGARPTGILGRTPVDTAPVGALGAPEAVGAPGPAGAPSASGGSASGGDSGLRGSPDGRPRPHRAWRAERREAMHQVARRTTANTSPRFGGDRVDRTDRVDLGRTDSRRSTP